MDKIQNLIDELEKLKKSFQNEKKYNYEFEEITNTQINFQSSGEISKPFKEDVKKLNKIFEGFINLSKGQYNISSKMEKLKEIKTNIENLLNGYLTVLNENKTNFNNSVDEKKNKKFMNLYKRLNIDLIDEFQSFSTLFNELYDNITNFANGLKKNKEAYEKLGKVIPKGDNIPENKVDDFKNKVYKAYRNIEELIFFVEDTLREIENTKKEWNEINDQINKRVDKINPLLINFQNINIDGIREINDRINNILDKFDAFKIQIGQSDVGIKRENMRLDILLIVDTTSTMSSYVYSLKDDLKSIIKSIKDDYPLVIPKIGFIGYKDFGDLVLGDDYIDIDFLINYKKLFEIIEKIEADGGEQNAKDVAGAFNLALEKSWGMGKKLAILITDSPCHGKEYSNYNDKFTDGYYDPNNTEFERKKINDYLEEFINKNIYLIGYKISSRTEVMYTKFQDFYKGKNKEDLFLKEEGKLKDIICNKVKDLLKDHKKEVINF
jgi:hypothetical protein